MLNIHNLSVSFGGTFLFEEITFRLGAGDRVEVLRGPEAVVVAGHVPEVVLAEPEDGGRAPQRRRSPPRPAARHRPARLRTQQEDRRGLQLDDRIHPGARPRKQGRALGLDDQADDAAQEALLQRGLLRLQHLLGAAGGRRAQADPAGEAPRRLGCCGSV